MERGKRGNAGQGGGGSPDWGGLPGVSEGLVAAPSSLTSEAGQKPLGVCPARPCGGWGAPLCACGYGRAGPRSPCLGSSCPSGHGDRPGTACEARAPRWDPLGDQHPARPSGEPSASGEGRRGALPRGVQPHPGPSGVAAGPCPGREAPSALGS